MDWLEVNGFSAPVGPLDSATTPCAGAFSISIPRPAGTLAGSIFFGDTLETDPRLDPETQRFPTSLRSLNFVPIARRG